MEATHALELLLAALGGALFAVLGMRRRPAAAAGEPDPTAVVERPHLAAEVERRLACATPERPLLVAVLDLDDFHGYAELFGPAAGNALLARLGAALVRAVGGRGGVHRTGPAEFSIVVPIHGEGPDRVLSVATAALFEEGQGFSVGCSQGSALLPVEAEDAAEGLRLAGERLREDRLARRAARRGRAGDALAAALRDRDEQKVEQRRELAELAEDTARKLGVADGEVEQIRIAAGLHDVGKMAIPERILDKAGPLDEEEWAFLRRHTAIGERIVAAAPDLADAAAMVRSIPERWDGHGYPDGLSGAEIPLGARVVAVCSAYDAMTTTRPYRRAMPVPAALGELRRFAGVQFDPDVVEAFCLALLDHRVER
ncbi:MAG: HD domain-containing phosphohydrolase [Thermoleophilaceae bacterium]